MPLSKTFRLMSIILAGTWAPILANVTGVVIDWKKQPISMVHITQQSSGATTTTDALGRFNLACSQVSILQTEGVNISV